MADKRFGKILRTASDKAKEAASVLREEFVKGTEGDSSPTPILFGTTGYDQIKALLRRGPEPSDASSAEAHAPAQPSAGETEAAGDPANDLEVTPNSGLVAWNGGESLDDEAAAAEVSGVLQRIDWKSVSTSAQERSGDVADRMKSLAEDVDWAKMKPVASKVATALVAAAATGQIGRLSGPTAIAVSRALQGNNVGEAAAALVVRKGPAGVVAGEVMKNFLKPPTGQPFATPGVSLRHRTNVFEAQLAELTEVTDETLH